MQPANPASRRLGGDRLRRETIPGGQALQAARGSPLFCSPGSRGADTSGMIARRGIETMTSRHFRGRAEAGMLTRDNAFKGAAAMRKIVRVVPWFLSAWI